MRNRERNRTRRREQGEVIERRPGSLKPFKRAELIMAALKATAANLKVTIMGTPARVEASLAHAEAVNLAEHYKSRGHGGKHRVKNKISWSRRFRDRSKYDPGNEERLHIAGTKRTQRVIPIKELRV